MKKSELANGYYMYGNKGSMWGKKPHIAHHGSSTTLCGTPMLATNWCEVEELDEIGCPDCLEIYQEIEQKYKCESCSGTGEMTIRVGEWGSENKPTESVIECVVCHGTGRISEDIKQELELEKKMWCTCKENHGSKRWEDGEHKDLYKHHYRCRKCGKVTQIG